MKGLVILCFMFVALLSVGCCTTSSETSASSETSVLDIISNAQYGENHASSEWAGRNWEFFGEEGGSVFQALATNISLSEFDSLSRLISSELGEPTYDKMDFPKELIPGADTGAFWMAWKDNDMFYYWCSDTLVVGFSIGDSEPNDIGYSYLYIDFSPYIPDN